MPSTTTKQRKFMRAAAKNPKFAKKAGIKQKVAKEFYAADERKGYAFGGGVLGRAIGRGMPQRTAMPPVERDMRIPELPAMLGRADGAIRGATGRMRIMRAKGGKVRAIKSALGRIFEVGTLSKNLDDEADYGRLERHYSVKAVDPKSARRVVGAKDPKHSVFYTREKGKRKGTLGSLGKVKLESEGT